MRIICKIQKGNIVIDDSPLFLVQYLEYQTNLHLILWVHKLSCSTLVLGLLFFLGTTIPNGRYMNKSKSISAWGKSDTKVNWYAWKFVYTWYSSLWPQP